VSEALNSIELLVLGQRVGDDEPRRFGPDKDVSRWSNAWLVDKGSQRDMSETPILHDGVEERAAHLAANVMRPFATEAEKRLLARRDAQLVSLYASERLKSGARCAPAVGAMTVQRIAELVSYCVLDGSAQALAPKDSSAYYIVLGQAVCSCIDFDGTGAGCL
jgi:hypothetical protein